MGARRVPLTELLENADVVSLHVPMLPQTRGLIEEAELQQMRSGAFLINSSRGPVIDRHALVRALQEGWIAGAGLDVFDPEPLPPESPLLELDNVVVTPHQAAHTQEAMFWMAAVAEDVLGVIEGREPRHPAPLA